MREHPLLLSGPQVQDVLSKRRTQIRIQLPDVFNSPPGLVGGWLAPGEWKHFGWSVPDHWGARWRGTYPSRWRCPFGKTGDRLWVRETFQAWRKVGHEHDEWEPIGVKKASTGNTIEYRATSKSTGPWTSSTQMPRWACRLVLPLVSVRIERLHDITEEDARAEAVGLFIPDDSKSSQIAMEYADQGLPHKAAFCANWQNTLGTWKINPWVAVAQWEALETR